MNKLGNDNIRPYWHVDLKWITAFLLIFFLGLTLFAYQLYKLTSPKIAVPTTTLLVATMFSGGDLDKTSDLEEAKKKFPPDAEGKIHPLPASPTVTILAKDLETLPPREIRLKIFQQVVEPIYYRGSKNDYASSLNDQEALKKMGALAFLNENTHKKIKNIFLASSAVTIGFLILLIKFSAGFGRFVSPALVFIATAIPGIAVTFFIFATSSQKAPPVNEQTGYGAMAGQILNIIGPNISKQFAYVYIPLFLLGLFLLLVSLISKVISNKKSRQAVLEKSN